MSSDEDPFELIEKGNAFEAACDYWRSAEYYSRSSICLRYRADGLSSWPRKGDGWDYHSAKEEKQRIIALYRAQSLEYLYKARHSLLEALQFENDRDRAQTLEVARTGTGSLDPICSMISSGDRTKRNRIFELLFSGRCEAFNVGTQLCTSEQVNHAAAGEPNKIQDLNDLNSSKQQVNPLLLVNESSWGNSPPTLNNDPSVGTGTHSDKPAENSSRSIFHYEKDDRQQSIESRLAELNSSLLPSVPSRHDSCSTRADDGENNKRMNEIRRGLGRLGVVLPESARKSDLMDRHLTSGDQVNLVVEQLKDEIRIERGIHVDGGGGSNEYADEHTYSNDDGIDETDSMFEGYEGGEYDVDALLTMAENLVAKSGVKLDGKGAFSSQITQIGKIQVLLLEARLCLELNPSSQDSNAQLKEVSKTEGLVEKDQSAKGLEKAVALMKNAYLCMQELMQHW
jgi:hypothetical protein